MSNTAPKLEEVVFDLDAEERPADEVREPFTTNVQGRVITMMDPEEMDWQDLEAIRAPTDFLRYALSPEDRSYLFGLEMPGWKLGKLVKAYMNHYGLEERHEKMLRQQRRDGLRSV